MLTELIVSAGAIGGYLYYKNPKVVFRKAVNNMLDSNSSFYNKQGQQVRLVKIKDNIITLDIRNVLGLEDFLKKQDYIETCLCSKVNIKQAGKYVEVELKNKPKKLLNFTIAPTREHELLCGYDEEGSPVITDMNKFPHILIGGDTGTGKSIFLMLTLANLINQYDNVELYMLQIRKSDLVVFSKCKQVKYMARNLEEAHAVIKHLNNICIEREKEIEKYLDKDILNIVDYNRYFKNKQMKYIYLILDEFSFFVPNNTDTTRDKRLKKEILSYIKNLVVSSRASGIFVITSLQKPTSTSIPVDIKSQLTTRVCFRIGDSATSMIVLNNGNGTKLEDRTAIIKTDREVISTMPNTTLKDIKTAIKDKIEEDKKYMDLKIVSVEEDKEIIKAVSSRQAKTNKNGVTKKKINLKDL